MGQIKNIKLHIVTDIKQTKQTNKQTNMAHKWSGSPILWRIRDILVGKELTIAARYARDQAPRSVPAPNIKPGIHHKLSDNYYGIVQDGRRDHKPPTVVLPQSVPALPEAETDEAVAEAATSAAVKRKVVTPGLLYRNM